MAKQPRIEIIKPSEAVRKRAMSAAKQDRSRHAPEFKVIHQQAKGVGKRRRDADHRDDHTRVSQRDHEQAVEMQKGGGGTKTHLRLAKCSREGGPRKGKKQEDEDENCKPERTLSQTLGRGKKTK